MEGKIKVGKKPRILEKTVFLETLSLNSLHGLKVIGSRESLEIVDGNGVPESYSVVL